MVFCDRLVILLVAASSRGKERIVKQDIQRRLGMDNSSRRKGRGCLWGW